MECSYGDCSLSISATFHILLFDYLLHCMLIGFLRDMCLGCSKLINVAVPGTIDERAINTKRVLNPWERNENHTLCLNSAKAVGCTVVNIGTQDFIEGRVCIHAFSIYRNAIVLINPTLVECSNGTSLLWKLMNN